MEPAFAKIQEERTTRKQENVWWVKKLGKMWTDGGGKRMGEVQLRLDF